MTIREAFVAELDEININEATLTKVLADAGLVEAAVYDQVLHQKVLDLSVAKALTLVLARPSISEGGYSISYNQASIKERIKSIYSKYGLSSPDRPKVRGVNPW